MFQFPGLALSRSDEVSLARFPHSDTPGSMLACSSPRLIAACHVLHRRLVPRHPPCALLHLTSTNHWSRIKKHAQMMRVFFTQSPRLPRISQLRRGAQDPFSQTHVVNKRRRRPEAGPRPLYFNQGFEEAGRVDSRELFGRPRRPTYSASPERR